MGGWGGGGENDHTDAGDGQAVGVLPSWFRAGRLPFDHS